MKFIELTRSEGGRVLINTDNISSVYMGKRLGRNSAAYVDVTVIQEITSADDHWEVVETMDEIVALLKAQEEK